MVPRWRCSSCHRRRGRGRTSRARRERHRRVPDDSGLQTEKGLHHWVHKDKTKTTKLATLKNSTLCNTKFPENWGCARCSMKWQGPYSSQKNLQNSQLAGIDVYSMFVELEIIWIGGGWANKLVFKNAQMAWLCQVHFLNWSWSDILDLWLYRGFGQSGKVATPTEFCS